MQAKVLLVLALLLAAPASAQTNETLEEVDAAADDATGILDVVGSAVEGVGDVAQATGDGIGSAAGSVGSALAATVALLESLAVASIQGLAHAGAGVSGGLAAAVLGVGTAAGFLGAALTAGLAWTGSGVGHGLALVGHGLALATGAYWDLVQGLRPDRMPTVAFASVTAVGAAGSAGAGGWAGFQALRKWGLLGAGGLAGVGGFTRINADDLLEHPMRQEIFSVIQQHPGIHASQLAREMDVGWGTITHHLDKLQKGRLVTTRKVNNQKCFFEMGGNISRQDMEIASALKGDTASTIAQFVGANPMTSQKRMAEALGISPALASFHVKKLTNLGVLDKVRHGKETLLTTSDGLRRVMQSGDPVIAAQLQDAGFEYSS